MSTDGPPGEGGNDANGRPPRAGTESPETVADRPPRSSPSDAPEGDAPATVMDRPSRDLSAAAAAAQAASSAGAQLAEPDLDALAAARQGARASSPVPATEPPALRTGAGATRGGSRTHASSLSLATAAEALHVEEVRRSRQFIALGWVISLLAIGAVPFVSAPRWMSIAMIAALVWGMVLSFYFHQKWRDPRKYVARDLTTLAVFATINAHVAVAYFGVFSPTPLIMVLGFHFIARSELDRPARYAFATGMICYTLAAGVIIAGVVPDPGMYASRDPLSRTTLALGALFVLGCYALAYYTGYAMRRATRASVEGLHRQTRLAAQRKALMDELRVDLERALRVGGPGRHTDEVVGSFELGNVLGRGAMGEVYEATHTGTGAPAAVKLLRRELLADPTHVARFLREVKASGALASPHVVRVLEASAGDAEGGGPPYLAMERLVGQTLAEVLRRDARLEPSAVLALVEQVGAGVDAAAAAGIVHRDLKPQNLYQAEVEGGGHAWKILDFGVATLADDTGTLTQGGIIGTPSYMAPEQAQGKRVDARADVYAIAAVAYRCLTGRHPFSAPDTPALLYAVVHRMPMRPTALAPLDADVDRWAALALAKDPGERFATGAAQAAALRDALAGGLDARLRRRADALIKKHGWEDAA